MNTFDVRSYGAVGDGVHKDTSAVQKAINTCHENGGGTVHFQSGIYICGTLNLKSNVELYLHGGAVIKGSPDQDDYSCKYSPQYDIEADFRTTSTAHLLCATNEKNIAIRGTGSINGNGTAFFGEIVNNGLLKRYSIPAWRPGHMLAFCDCENILMEGVRLEQSPTYSLWTYCCKNIHISNVTIENPPETPNGDGIDIECSQDVHICNCTIDTADDCIACYSGLPDSRFNEKNTYACRNINVSNCSLKSVCNGIRLGPHGDSYIENAVFSNLTINAGSGIGFHLYKNSLGKKKGTFLETRHGPIIRNISFSNIVMKTQYAPLFMEIHDYAGAPACLRNIRFSDMNIESECCSYISGSEKIPVENLSLNNINMTLNCNNAYQKDASAYIPPRLGARECRIIPYVFLFRHVNQLHLNNVLIDTEEASYLLSAGVLFEKIQFLGVKDVRRAGKLGRSVFYEDKRIACVEKELLT